MRVEDGAVVSESIGRTPGRIAALYQASGPGALRLAYLMTGDRTLAEDLVQDAFVRVIGRLGHLRDGASFDAYLRRAVVNLSKNHFRRRAVERAHLERLRGERPGAVPGPDPGERDRLREVLLKLPERQRAAIALRYLEDRSEAEIAAVLECASGTVRSLISRGTATLREELGDDHE